MILLVLIVLGLVLGSFVNALVWRLHEQEKLSNQKKAELSQLSILHGRSICPKCKHQLAAKDLMPVLSWVYLKGRCRYCHRPISWQYPAVELITTGLFVFSWAYWPMPLTGIGLFEFILWLIFLTGLIALSVYDLKWFLLPNRLVYPLVGLALVQIVIILMFYHGGFSVLSSAFWGVLLAGGLFYVIFQLSNGKWIGGGDVKLGVLLGLLVGGPFNSILTLFIASCSGTLLSLPLVLAGRAKRNTHLPFGPLLAVGIVVIRLFGISISHWLKSGHI
ncbi:MAG TPA: prepilin peptidase [Candidatus Binatia bacterium]|nr:prepilin peptidase [Candidatus Binatia bacterium]